MPIPTPADDDYAKEVESAATALAEIQGDHCFHPLHDTEAGMRARQEWRIRARAILDAVEHRALWDEAHKVDALLREYGFEYPLGARGVKDALGMWQCQINDPEFLRRRIAKLLDAALKVPADRND